MPEGSHRFQVGSISCTVLSDGYYSYPASWFFPNAAPEDLSRALESHHLPTDAVLSPYTCLLIETGRHVVLVDTGAGEYSRSSGAIQARLEVAGIRPKDVDTVILTHAHPDHIGGAIDLFGRPAFPNARYVLSELEWEFWTAARIRPEPSAFARSGQGFHRLHGAPLPRSAAPPDRAHRTGNRSRARCGGHSRAGSHARPSGRH